MRRSQNLRCPFSVSSQRLCILTSLSVQSVVNCINKYRKKCIMQVRMSKNETTMYTLVCLFDCRRDKYIMIGLWLCHYYQQAYFYYLCTTYHVLLCIHNIMCFKGLPWYTIVYDQNPVSVLRTETGFWYCKPKTKVQFQHRSQKPFLTFPACF